MNAQGHYRKDGSYIGYDYDSQHWIDTSVTCFRDPNYPPGSANNPLTGNGIKFEDTETIRVSAY